MSHPDLPPELCRLLESMVEPIALAVVEGESGCEAQTAEVSIWGVTWRVTLEREFGS